MMSVDDHYNEGVFYDGEVGTFVEIEPADGPEGEAVLSPVDIEGGTTALDTEEWEAKQEELLPVPEDAVEDPVAYYEHVIETLRRRTPEDPGVGFMYADAMTEVAELHPE